MDRLHEAVEGDFRLQEQLPQVDHADDGVDALDVNRHFCQAVFPHGDGGGRRKRGDLPRDHVHPRLHDVTDLEIA